MTQIPKSAILIVRYIRENVPRPKKTKHCLNVALCKAIDEKGGFPHEIFVDLSDWILAVGVRAAIDLIWRDEE